MGYYCLKASDVRANAVSMLLQTRIAKLIQLNWWNKWNNKNEWFQWHRLSCLCRIYGDD